MKGIRTFLIGSGLVMGLAACTGQSVVLSDAPPEDIDRTRGQQISASSCGFQLVQLIPMGTNGRHEKAHERLKAQAGGNYIGDVQVTEKWYYGVIGSVYCTELNAKAYPKRAS
jgi:hypothetical protein